jgi:predicted phage tail protein
MQTVRKTSAAWRGIPPGTQAQKYIQGIGTENEISVGTEVSSTTPGRTFTNAAVSRSPAPEMAIAFQTGERWRSGWLFN